MSGKKKSGCVVAAIMGLIVLIVGAAGVAIFSYRALILGKEQVKQRIEAHEQRARTAENAAAAALAEEERLSVVLREGRLPDYSGYQAGAPLGPEMYLAWKLDTGATSLAKEAFLERAEGAEVSWRLKAGDLQSNGDGVFGTFHLTYWMAGHDGQNRQAGAEAVECHFPGEARDSLLGIRRGETVLVRGRLSLTSGRVVLEDARRVTEEVEK
jgi:hypothetical protein